MRTIQIKRFTVARLVVAAIVMAGLGLVACHGLTSQSISPTMKTPAMPPYPVSKSVNHVDDYHGTAVADPYRWLETDDADSQNWVSAQRDYAENYLATLPTRSDYKKRLTELWNYERYSAPSEHGGRYFYSYNNGLQNQSVMFVQDNANATARQLLDPNTLSTDGTVALSDSTVSKNGKYLAYSVSKSGSDWQEWFVRDVDSGQDLSDHLQWVKFSSAEWTPDGKGFFYARYDAPKSGEELSGQNYFQKLYYHRLGTEQSADTLVYHRADEKEWGFGATVSDDGAWLVIPVWQGTDSRNRIFYQALTGSDQTVKPLVDTLEAEYSFLGNDGSVFYFKTDLNAPRGRVIAIDVNKPKQENWQERVPQSANTLQTAFIAGNRLVLGYLKDAVSHVEVRSLNGKLEHTLSVPDLGTVGGFSGKRDSEELFYSVTAYVRPTTIYRFDLASKQASVFRAPKVAFDASQFESRQVFYTSKDGTRVPMMLSYKKGLQQNSKTPTILYGYGGFNIAMTPK